METQNEYALVDRLRAILEVLRAGPATARQIGKRLGLADDEQALAESETKKIKRDVRALKDLGFQIEEQGKPIRFTLHGAPAPFFSSDGD